MRTSTSLRWLAVAVSAAMLLAVAAACSSETVEVPGETVVVEKVVTETVQVPGETVVVEKVVTETVEVPGETVTVEVVKEVVVIATPVPAAPDAMEAIQAGTATILTPPLATNGLTRSMVLGMQAISRWCTPGLWASTLWMAV